MSGRRGRDPTSSLSLRFLEVPARRRSARRRCHGRVTSGPRRPRSAARRSLNRPGVSGRPICERQMESWTRSANYPLQLRERAVRSGLAEVRPDYRLDRPAIVAVARARPGIGWPRALPKRVRQAAGGTLGSGRARSWSLPGSGGSPLATHIARWLPVKNGLTPHGLRHGHKTWMAEDGDPRDPRRAATDTRSRDARPVRRLLSADARRN